ncbi:cupin domain-containing protein [Salinifilum ghardaiensis]
MVLHPGWRWSRDVRPLAGTDWCEAPHFQYHVSGTVRVRMSSGEEFDVGPGQVSYLPQGHDAWVLGDEDAVIVDWAAATDYARPT